MIDYLIMGSYPLWEVILKLYYWGKLISLREVISYGILSYYGNSYESLFYNKKSSEDGKLSYFGRYIMMEIDDLDGSYLDTEWYGFVYFDGWGRDIVSIKYLNMVYIWIINKRDISLGISSISLIGFIPFRLILLNSIGLIKFIDLEISYSNWIISILWFDRD